MLPKGNSYGSGRGEFARHLGENADLDQPRNNATRAVPRGCVASRRLPSLCAGCAFLGFNIFHLVWKKGDAPLSRTASRSSRQSAGHHESRGGRLELRSGRHVDRPAAEEPFDESFDDHEFEGEVQPLPEDAIDEAVDDEPDAAHTGEDDQIDDPVRIYLMQMGEIPMLSRREEKSVAQRIVRSRRRFRCCMLASDYVLYAAKGLLEGVRDNKLRLDRTMEVSVVNVGEKSRLLKVLTPNLRTLDHLLLQNKRDFALAVARRQPAKCRRAAWRRLLNRRVKAVRLVEEMGLRTQRLQPLLGKLRQLAERMDAIRRQLAAPCRNEDDLARHAELRKELRHLMRTVQESPATLRRRLAG